MLVRAVVELVTEYSLGWEVSVGRLQVDLRGSRSSAMCPSISLFKIIQLVLYGKKERRTERERQTERDKKDGKK